MQWPRVSAMVIIKISETPRYIEDNALKKSQILPSRFLIPFLQFFFPNFLKKLLMQNTLLLRETKTQIC